MGAKIERRGVTVAALALSCDENRKKKVQIGIKIADTKDRDANKNMGCRLQTMKQVSRIHFIWGATALVAFLVGYFLLPSSPEKGQFSIPRTGERASSKSGLEDERDGSRIKRGEMAGVGLGAGAKEGISSILSQKVVLSESEITNLGDRM